MSFPIKAILISLFCFYSWFPSESQPLRSKSLLFSGKVRGDVSSVRALQFFFCEKYIFGNDNSVKVNLELDKNGCFQFKLPSITHAIKMRELVVVYNKMRNVSYDHDIVRDFVTEPGDSIYIIIDINHNHIENIFFSGTQALKYQCRYSISKLYDSFEEKRIRTAKTLESRYWDIKNFDTIFHIFDLYQKRMEKLLNEQKGKLSPFLYKVMKADIISEIQILKVTDLADYYSRFLEDPLLNRQSNIIVIRKFYNKHLVSPMMFPDSVVDLCPNYLEYLIRNEQTILTFQKRIEVDSITFHDLYYAIKRKYARSIGEHLIMLLIIDPIKNGKLIAMQNASNTYISDALAYMKNPDFKKKIKSSPFFKAATGSVAYNFNLPDTSGRKVSLSSLKGNVVLMDIWFTGCTGCAIFTSMLKKDIIPKIEDKKNFKIVSICIDSSKSMWKRSLQSGKYSGPGNIDLRIEQENGQYDFYKMPLIMYYGLQGLPFILLIDKEGKIISCFYGPPDSKILLEKIKESLNSSFDSKSMNTSAS